MKKRIVGIMASVAVAFGAVAGEFRVFTDPQGRAIEAKIVSFDAVKGQIEIERNDGKRVWIVPSVFSADDQNYIKQWIDANRILSDENLLVRFAKKKGESFKKGMTDEDTASESSKGEIIHYEITLKNRSKKPIEAMKIEYRYFVRVKQDGKADKLKEIGVKTVTVDRIEAGESYTFTTDNQTIQDTYDKKRVQDPGRQSMGDIGYEYTKLTEDELMGVWLKIYGPEVEGESSVRDVCEPEDLQKEVTWAGKFVEP